TRPATDSFRVHHRRKRKKKIKSKGNGNSRVLWVGVGSVSHRKTNPTPSCFPIHLIHAWRGWTNRHT
ncbi:hypothetical protein, partial [Stenotrophomonas maltophilia]|uniref:hypothetical protein n=1 Tax=Stenotrophomonas maltophilia TaxID=40324 RepID=UPI0021C5A5E4